ncbi:MAG: thymidine phosphorylase [Gemmatimonadota bacterium]|nr:thymidine phosphorylase [Gemmatimonadota bacterium]
MIPQRVIEAKRDGQTLSPQQLTELLTGYARGEVPEHQMAAFLMAVVFRGLEDEELATLLTVMLESGAVLDLSHLSPHRVDKHSTGGVGDKTSLVLAPLVACLGGMVPMMSGRSLGHTGGTLDKLESIPGFRTGLDLGEFERVLGRVGCAMIGASERIAPLDRRLYALRDLTGTVPSPALMTASILSKKLAEGINALVLDVKVGQAAFLPDLEDARALARTMVRVASERGVPTVARLTAMDRPLGHAVGNALEVAEAVRALSGEGPEDLVQLCVELGAEMLVTGGVEAGLDTARSRCRAALASGRARERFAALVEAQGGDRRVVDDPALLARAPERAVVHAASSGVVRSIDARALGWATVELGGGRRHADDAIDAAVGFEIQARPGGSVSVGEALGIVHARTPADLERGIARLQAAIDIGEDGGPPPLPLLLERIDAQAIRVRGAPPAH